MSCTCKPNHPHVVIRHHRQKNFVLDARHFEVKLRAYVKGECQQLWKLVCAECGRFFIINIGNGLYLSLRGHAQIGDHVATCERHYSLNQEWYINSDGSIVNAGGRGNLAIDMPRLEAVTSSEVQVTVVRSRTDTQIFEIITPGHHNSSYDTPSYDSRISVKNTNKRNYQEAIREDDFSCKTHSKYITIRHYRRRQFVLEAGNYGVTLKWNDSGRLEQIWNLICAHHGRFFIRNCGNGNFLDVRIKVSGDYHATTSTWNCQPSQTWYITSDGSIVNGGRNRNMAIDLYDQIFVDDNVIVVMKKSGADTQTFLLVYSDRVSTKQQDLQESFGSGHSQTLRTVDDEPDESNSGSKSVLIRHHRRKEFVLDAVGGMVKLKITDYQRLSQLWDLEFAAKGRFYIKNVANGRYLTIDTNALNGDTVTLCPGTCNLNQQWYINSDGSIVNAVQYKNLAIDIGDEISLDDNEVILTDQNGEDTQKFLLLRTNYKGQ